MADQTAAEKAAADKAEAEKKAAADKTAAAKKKGKIKYVGTSDVREIDAAAFKSIGIEDQGKVRFDRSNNWSIKAEDVTSDALEYFDQQDDGFTVVPAED